MKPVEKNIIGLSFLAIYLFFLVYTWFIVPSGWIVDVIGSIIGFFLIFLLADWACMGKIELILAGLVFIPNFLGAFGFYNFTFSIFAYDNIVHFINSGIGAYIICNIFVKKFFVSREVEKDFFQSHKWLMLVAVFSIAIMLGIVIEIFEFGGSFILGPTRANDGTFGILNPDPEPNTFGDPLQINYVDTMTDIIVNMFGAAIGIWLYHLFPFKKLKIMRLKEIIAKRKARLKERIILREKRIAARKKKN